MASNIEKGFIPLPKVEQEVTDETIIMSLNLPDYVDQDRIGVNLAGISKLCKLGGITHLVVIGNTGEETSHVVPEVAGVNSDGSASLSKKIEKVIVPTFETNPMHNGKDNETISTRTIGLYVDINVDELGNRIAETSEGVHSPKAWAKELDKGIKTPIRKAGNQNLLHHLESFDKTDFRVMAFMTGLTIAVYIPVYSVFDPHSLILPGELAVYRMFSALTRKEHPDFRFSLFPGFQVDRAIALGIMGRTKTLIKDLRQDKK